MDAVVILGFGVLTAAQTGNTIMLAVSLVQHHFAAGFHSLISVAGYVSGAAIGELFVTERRTSEHRFSRVTAALLVELLVLSTLLILWHSSDTQSASVPAGFLIVLAAIAMGIQSAAVLQFHSGPKTTYVTGTLTTFTTKAVQWFRFLETAPATRQQWSSAGPSSSSHPWMYGLSWVVYAVGAALGGLLFLRVHATALIMPVLSIIAAILAGIGRDR